MKGKDNTSEDNKNSALLFNSTAAEVLVYVHSIRRCWECKPVAPYSCIFSCTLSEGRAVSVVTLNTGRALRGAVVGGVGIPL